MTEAGFLAFGNKRRTFTNVDKSSVYILILKTCMMTTHRRRMTKNWLLSRIGRMGRMGKRLKWIIPFGGILAPWFSYKIFHSKLLNTFFDMLLLYSSVFLTLLKISAVDGDCSVRVSGENTGNALQEPVNKTPSLTTIPHKEKNNSVLGKCTRCRLLSNSMYEVCWFCNICGCRITELFIYRT